MFLLMFNIVKDVCLQFCASLFFSCLVFDKKNEEEKMKEEEEEVELSSTNICFHFVFLVSIYVENLCV